MFFNFLEDVILPKKIRNSELYYFGGTSVQTAAGLL